MHPYTRALVSLAGYGTAKKAKVSHKTEAWRRYAQALGGYDTLGTGTKATLIIGRRTGLAYGGWREGEKIPTRAAIASVVGRRAEQIGLKAAGLTYVSAGGYYKGRPEPSLKVDLIWTAEASERTRSIFYRNINKLAQKVAGDLAQREIYVEWSGPRRQGRTDRATPVAAPPAAKQDRFCRWVREFSRSARTRPEDSCYAKARGR